LLLLLLLLLQWLLCSRPLRLHLHRVHKLAFAQWLDMRLRLLHLIITRGPALHWSLRHTHPTTAVWAPIDMLCWLWLRMR
jgi:hypothetical protein